MLKSILTGELFECTKMLGTFLQLSARRIIEQCGGEVTGGKLFLCDAGGCVIMHPKFGDMLLEKINAYTFFSMEKCLRLIFVYPEHQLSFQSKNSSAGQYQGGIRLENGLCLSISGLKQEDDEAYAMALAVASGLATDKYAIELMSISDNYDNYLRKLKIVNSNMS